MSENKYPIGDGKPGDTFMVYRKDLEREIKPFDQSVTKTIAHGMLKDGRNYQIHVTITTDEDDFIEE